MNYNRHLMLYYACSIPTLTSMPMTAIFWKGVMSIWVMTIFILYYLGFLLYKIGKLEWRSSSSEFNAAVTVKYNFNVYIYFFLFVKVGLKNFSFVLSFSSIYCFVFQFLITLLIAVLFYFCHSFLVEFHTTGFIHFKMESTHCLLQIIKSVDLVWFNIR